MNKLNFDAVIFDLDGVITKTALVHAVAWKEMFDEFLKKYAKENGGVFQEFTHTNDYLPYVDGKPRYKGVESFLQSRNIQIPFGTVEDATEMETICGLGNRKNVVFNNILERDGVETYPSTVELIKELKKLDIRVGVASSSKNCKQVLERANLLHYFETRVDGEVSAELGLKGKPEPDIFTVASDELGVTYDKTVIVEDAVSGVQAGRKGNFGLVLGVAREENTDELYIHGADIVVSDLSEIGGVKGIKAWFEKELPKDLWSITYHGYDQKKERSREAMLTTGNGYFGTRGSLEEASANPNNYPGTYMAGLYNRLESPVGDRLIENEDFVNAANWHSLSFKIGEGEWFDPNKDKIIQIKRVLDLSSGLLFRKMITEDHLGHQTLIESKRIASMADPHLGGVEYSITPLNYSDFIRVKSGLLIPPKNDGVERYSQLNQDHMEPLDQGGENSLAYIRGKTVQSGVEVAVASDLKVHYNDKPLSVDFVHKQVKGSVNTYVKALTNKNETLKIEKLVCLCNTLSKEIKDPVSFVRSKAKSISSFYALLNDSKKTWSDLWAKADMKLTGDRLSQKLLRLHIYHSLVTCSPHNKKIDFGIPARGLHGEAYRGHIFWDELYILPFFCLHFPEIAKSVLLYRYRRLDKARDYAREHGYLGAMFPWQSGSDGREETQVIHLNPVSGEWGDDYSSLQRHISIAVAYNVWNYYHITGDLEFLNQYGAELFLDICRFWSSKAKQDKNTGRYSIDKVMGPDEFHEKMPGNEKGGVKDNAYTNIMVVWLFYRAFDILKQMDGARKKEVLKKIDLSEEELANWKEELKQMNLSVSKEGIIEQFEGYFKLKEIDFDAYREKYKNIYRMDRILKAEGKSPDDYKVAKQADTLMLFYNLNPETVHDIVQELGYQLPEGYLEKNFDYYIRRCTHGSTLSRVVYAYVASVLSHKKLAWDLYFEALQSDYVDIQGGTTAEGIHMGVMTGTVMMALTAFAGLNYHDNTLKIDPDLPEHWREFKFNCSFKGVNYEVLIIKDLLIVRSDKKTSLNISGKEYEMDGKTDLKIHFR
jgi:beta-phosphoglucomutase family hydrolase